MNDLIKKTLARIKQEHIAPEPRWKFLARKAALWLGVVILVAVGAVAVAAVYGLLSQLDWDIYRTMHQTRLSYGASLLPYPWLVILGIFLAVAIWGVRKTENGYRLSWLKILSIVLGGFFLLGLLFSFFGFGNRAHNMMRGSMPHLMQYAVTKETQWMQPEEGLLAGTILVIEENQFQLTDLNGKKWTVGSSEKTMIRPVVDFSAGQMVKIMGRKTADQIFQAAEIRPWMGRGEMNSGQGHSQMRNNLK